MVAMKVLFHAQPSPVVADWQRLAECVGIVCELSDVASGSQLAPMPAEIAAGKTKAMVLDVSSLARGWNIEQITEWAGRFKQSEVSILLLVSGCGEGVDAFVEALSGGAVRGIVSSSRANRVEFATDLSQELNGHFFKREAEETLALNLSAIGQPDVIMTLDGAPALVRVKVGSMSIFIWATNRVFDVSRPLAAEKEFELAVDEYVPAIIFLRFACANQCWNNPSPGAGIVIDDPLLKKNYGFINFCRLLDSARQHHYHVTLAFIPWNHWRSRAAKARMFLEHADCFSVCVHGCDHTNREFGSTDYQDLLGRNFVASRRMEQHRERTGLACEPLMVCPQEQYSLEAMRAFADSRQFNGVVCTACMPRNLRAPSICGADLLLPAQDSFFGVPVFKRHYWGDMATFAMALFLGKPAILVEHHEFFRRGPGGVEEFVAKLAAIHPGIAWTSLAETVRHTHLRRQVSADRHEIRFFTDHFQMDHGGGKAAYRLVRRIPATTQVQAVMVDGANAPFVQEDGWLRFDLAAEEPRTFGIAIQAPAIRPAKAYAHGMRYHAAVAVRRGLSEFRDNVIARNDFFLRFARSLARSMKQTGN